jgi:hypothetical protein
LELDFALVVVLVFSFGFWSQFWFWLLDRFFSSVWVLVFGFAFDLV